MVGRFEGRVALVTGAGRGLGRAYALALAAEGARVVVNDVDADGAGAGEGRDGVVAEIRRLGGEAVADDGDVVSGAGPLVARAFGVWGRLDLVVNNAGISGGGAIDALDPADFDRMIDVHYRGTVAVLRAAWPLLRQAGYGRVVNTSSGSVAGVPGSSAYVSAKAAVFGLTRALALDGRRHGIVVNAVMPVAWTRMTERLPEGGLRSYLSGRCAPEKVAPLVASLLCEEVPCTGETFSVGGGIAARVVLAMAPGYLSAEPSIDDYLAHFAQICDLEGMFVPADSMAEMVYRAGQLGITLSGPTNRNGELA